MVSLKIGEFVLCLICMIINGMMLAIMAYWIGELLSKYKQDKEFILDYIKKHKRGNELPSKLIYKYLSNEEKQNILKKRGD